MTNAFDTAVLRFFANLNTPAWLDALVLFWTNFSLPILVAVAIALLFFHKTRMTAAVGGVAVVLSPVLVELVWKNLFDRVRPYDLYDWARLIGPPSRSFSFPSGHTSFAFALCVGLCFGSPARVKIALVAWAVSTAFTRVYLSIHYATDVLAGAVNGTLCAVTAYLIVSASCRLIQSKRARLAE